jgi:hypothetical protein
MANTGLEFCALCASLVLSLAGFAAAAAPPVTVAQNAGTIGRYDVYELTLTNATPYENPWEDVSIAATFTAPSARTYAVGGFYYSADTWKFRFAPMEAGKWTWALTYTDGGGVFKAAGDFACVTSNNSGFLRIHPNNPYRFVTEGDGRAFYPLGFSTPVPAVRPGSTWEEHNWSTDANGQRTTLDDFLLCFANAGLNMLRTMNQGDMCGFSFIPGGGINIKGTGKNKYDMLAGQWGDRFLEGVHRAGAKCQMVIWANPSSFVPKYDLTNPAVRQACLNYHQYIVNRFSAYVDVWEMCNENRHVPQSYADAIAAFLRSHDPYRHPITISYDQPELADQSPFDITSPHGYYRVQNLSVDDVIRGVVAAMKKRYPNKPVLYGECGNSAPVGGHDPLRYRLMIWTAFFNEGGLIFWNGAGKSAFQYGGIANQYFGAEERSAAKILSDFSSDFDPLAGPARVTLAPAKEMRGYALASGVDFGLYIVHPASQNAPLSGASVRLTVPADGMHGEWVDPGSGAVLQSFEAGPGDQTLGIPTFTADIALRLRAGTPQPVIRFSRSSYDVPGDRDSVTLTVNRDGDAGTAVTVDYATNDGLAKAGADYTSASGTLSWAAGDGNPKMLTVPVIKDTTVKADRDFRVVLSNPTGGATLGAARAALVTVSNVITDRAVFSEPVYTVSKNAGRAGITVNRIGGGGPLTIEFTTGAGTAVAGTDYAFIPKPPTAPTLTWGAGDTSPKTLFVTILDGDKLGNKTLDLNMSGGTAFGLPCRATLVIVDDATMSPGILHFSGYTSLVSTGYGEPGACYPVVPAGAAKATVSVSRTDGSHGAVSVEYTTIAAGTAAPGVNYSATRGTLSWADGESADKMITVPIFDRRGETGDLTLWLRLGKPTGGAILTHPQAALVTLAYPAGDTMPGNTKQSAK